MNILTSTKHIKEKHFTDGRNLVKVLPLEEEDSSNDVGSFIEELHSKGS